MFCKTRVTSLASTTLRSKTIVKYNSLIQDMKVMKKMKIGMKCKLHKQFKNRLLIRIYHILKIGQVTIDFEVFNRQTSESMQPIH